MSKPSFSVRVRAFVAKHWKSLVTALTAGVILLIAIFKTRKPGSPDDTPTVPSGPMRAAQAHEQGALERQRALEARATQEAAAQLSAELEAAEKLRAEEERLRRDGVDAGASAESANAYADKISRRKE
jgi:hypothetical protein